MAGRRLSYTEEQAREAIAASLSWAESLRRLGLCPSGGGWRVLKKHAAEWDISTAHFDPNRSRQGNLAPKRPLREVMVSGSTYSRYHLKCRLYAEGLKQPRCELCGQGDIWRGQAMSMILDHINGIRDDHRLENLRIVCPNCAATLDTHCGRKNRIQRPIRACKRCGADFVERSRSQRYCSHACGTRWDRSQIRGRPKPRARKVERPPREKLLAEIEATNYCAVGRKYSVSDNAVRKWVRFYEREAERAVPEGVRGET
ncbi:MAG TPA: hypothetical protein VMT37_05705 [Solirubrobacterales bacterium]|nr:hypothetical protein [Solirubrobacterales bacterium]